MQVQSSRWVLDRARLVIGNANSLAACWLQAKRKTDGACTAEINGATVIGTVPARRARQRTSSAATAATDTTNYKLLRTCPKSHYISRVPACRTCSPDPEPARSHSSEGLGFGDSPEADLKSLDDRPWMQMRSCGASGGFAYSSGAGQRRREQSLLRKLHTRQPL